MARKSKFDKAWNGIVAALEKIQILLDTAEENADELSTLQTENKTLTKKLAVFTKALALLNGKDAKPTKKRGKHRGRPKGSKNAAKTVKAAKPKTAKPKAVKPKTVKATKTVKPKTVKAIKLVKTVVATKTETAPVTTPTVPATITKD